MNALQNDINPPKEKWGHIVSHTDTEIKGFFGEYRFLSNLWPCKVVIDGEEYPSVENAYQAIKYQKNQRDYFKSCSGRDAARYTKTTPMTNWTTKEWDQKKLSIMKGLLLQKFDKNINPELAIKLDETNNKYLEETNYWGDEFWGISKNESSEVGTGENNLGKLLMEIRGIYRKFLL